MSFPFLQLQIRYGKHIWNIKLYERQCIVIITKMGTIDMHRLFLLSWPLTFDLDLQTFGKKIATIIFETYSSRWTFWYITTLIKKEKVRGDISNCTICDISAFVFRRESRKQCNQWSVTREKGNMGSKQKVQTHSLRNIFKQETGETLSIMLNGV